MLMQNINIKIEKSPIPLIWIDTSVIISIAKAVNGENIQSKEKYLYLYEKIKELTKNEKIICPKADQYEEIEIGGRLEKECRKIQQQLAVGIKVMHRLGIQDHLIAVFMKAYIDSEEEIILNFEDIFYKNPIKELRENIASGFTVDVHMPKHKSIMDSSKNSKDIIHVKWEKIRKEKIATGITYDQQLKLEYNAHLKSHMGLARDYFEKMEQGKLDFMDHLGITSFMIYINTWLELAKNFDLKKFVSFFVSSTFKEIPIIDVRSKLLAKLVTSIRPIQSGDCMDTEHLSAVIPYFNIVITDRIMKNIVRGLGLDKKYRCLVYAMEDFEEIKSFFEKTK